MKISSSLLLSLIALATASTASPDREQFCRIQKIYGGTGRVYTIRADGVDDIPGKCGGLWDNLKGNGGCLWPRHTSCETVKGKLEWKFQTSFACGDSAVEAAWFAATEKNKFGFIHCKERDDPEEEEIDPLLDFFGLDFRRLIEEYEKNNP